jgi:hypothetical protein
MEVFYLVKNATKRSMFKQLKDAVRMKFGMDYGCFHDVIFTEEKDANYKWDTKTAQPVPIIKGLR